MSQVFHETDHACVASFCPYFDLAAVGSWESSLELAQYDPENRRCQQLRRWLRWRSTSDTDSARKIFPARIILCTSEVSQCAKTWTPPSPYTLSTYPMIYGLSERYS